MSWISRLACLSGLILSLACAGPLRAQEVDVALVLAVDVSRSMSHEELAIQREGYAAAINHPQVVRAIRDGPYGRIAIAMFEWASDLNQTDVFGWTIIESQEDADRVSAIIRSATNTRQSRTSIAGAITRGTALLEAVPYRAFRQVIDISGDGPNNQGEPVTISRTAALKKGIVINGLPLMTRGGTPAFFNIEALDQYYQDCVIGGPGSFIVPVNTWDQFPEAVRRKLVLEIGGLLPDEATVIPAQARPKTDCMVGEKIWQQRQWLFDGR